jgi:hypothetical protein
MLKIGHFGKWTKNTWKVLKCGAGEGWRRSDWTDSVENEVLLRVKYETNVVHAIKGMKGNWILRILCRNCFIKHVIEEKIT